jgi:hypothetical protein
MTEANSGCMGMTFGREEMQWLIVILATITKIEGQILKAQNVFYTKCGLLTKNSLNTGK